MISTQVHLKPHVRLPDPVTATIALELDEPSAREPEGQIKSVAHSLVQSATTLTADRFHKATAPSVVSASRTVALSSHEELSFPPAPLGAIRLKFKLLLEQEAEGRAVLTNPSRPDNDRFEAKIWYDAVNAIGEVTCPFCFYALPARDVVDEKKWQ